jgi:hypothetical protein
MSNENYNLQAFQHPMPQLHGANYNLQALPGVMPVLPHVVPPMPRVENYNLQVLQHAMPPLPQANATFQQLLGLQQQQQPYFYYSTQPSQVYFYLVNRQKLM